jgi:glutamate:GABA antiporter
MTTASLSADEELLDAEETLAAEEEKSKLRKHFGRFDMLFFLICTLVGVDTLGAVASNGAEGFTWMIFLAIFFFVPYALLTAELGSAFTGEGGCYVWTRLAWGRFVAAINTVLYWLSNPVWMGGLLCITAVETFNTFFWDLGGVGKYLFAAAFIWFGVWAAILSFGVGKWIPTLGAWARIVLLGFFSLSVVVYAIANGSTFRRPASSRRATRCSSRSSRCCSSTSSASSCPAPPATR